MVFIMPNIIDYCIDRLDEHPSAQSIQTISTPPHNHHAYNQRVMDDEGFVSFRLKKEREACFNKQLKPKLYVFGNLVITRTDAIFEHDTMFVEPSLGVFVDKFSAIDVDTQYDLDMLNCLKG